MEERRNIYINISIPVHVEAGGVFVRFVQGLPGKTGGVGGRRLHSIVCVAVFFGRVAAFVFDIPCSKSSSKDNRKSKIF